MNSIALIFLRNKNNSYAQFLENRCHSIFEHLIAADSEIRDFLVLSLAQ